MTQRDIIARIRVVDAERVRASRAQHRAIVQRSVVELARLAVKLADHIEQTPK